MEELDFSARFPHTADVNLKLNQGKNHSVFPKSQPARDEFPFKAGRSNAALTIYLTVSHGYPEFKIPYFDNGDRKFRRFSTWDAVRDVGNQMLGQLSAGNTCVLTLANQDRAAYLAATDALRETGLPLDRAAIQFAEASKILDGTGSIIEAARFFANHQRKTVHVDRAVEKVVEEFIKEKTAAKKSARYLYDLKYRLGKVKDSFNCDIASVDRAIIQKFLSGLNLGPRSYNNFLGILITLFRFAKKRNYVAANWDEFASIDRMNDKGGAIEIFSPDELASLLEHADPELSLFLAIGAFAGLRSAEICRLDWKSINFETGFITVEAGNAKTAARRTVLITSNLKAWLLPQAKTSGPVVTQNETGLYAKLRKLAKASKTAWKNNALRHSFISYCVAKSQDVNKTALEAGNSPAIIFRNYRALVTPKEATRWFSIAPDDSSDGKITWLKVA